MHAHKFTTRFLFTTILALPACLFAQVKDTIVIKTPVTVQQPILDRISRLPSLADFTHQLGTHFEYELNETGNFAVVNITSNLKMSNYIVKLQQGTGEFEKSGVNAKKTPTHYLEPSVTRFEEVINTINNPLNGDRVVNKDLAVTITVFVRSFSDQTDNKQFRASKEATWNETIFNNNARTRNESLGKIEAFAKSVAKEMATKFLAQRQVSYFVVNKFNNTCTLTAGTEQGVKLGDVFDVGPVIPTIHPVTGVKLGDTHQALGKVKVVFTDKSISKCEIISDTGIDTNNRQTPMIARPSLN